MELEIHERNDDGLILTSFAGASYGYLWKTEVEARMFKKLCKSGFELEESAGIVKFATEEMRYNTDLYYEIAGLSLLKNVQLNKEE